MKRILTSILLGLAAAMVLIPAQAEIVQFSDEHCADLASFTAVAAQAATEEIPYSVMRIAHHQSFGGTGIVAKVALDLTRESYLIYSKAPQRLTDRERGELAQGVYDQCMETAQPGIVTYDLSPDWNLDPFDIRPSGPATSGPKTRL